MTLPKKALFDLPEGVIYLDGNSLGPLPKGAQARVAEVLAQEWGQGLIRSWNSAGWMAQPAALGDKIARLIGAPRGSVMVGDTLSLQVYQALHAALHLQPDRREILSQRGNFPSDLYMAQGLVDTLGQGHRIKLCEPDQVVESLSSDVAAVLLTHVDYRTGRLYDMAAVTRAVQASGAVMIWDLAHSTGAVPTPLSGAEFAVGCTYKYLNAGPGAPAFIHIRPDLIDAITPALPGWLGHADPFAMSERYRPGPGMERMRIGTPPVVQMALLEVALALWDGVEMSEIRAASIALAELLIAEVARHCPELRLASPRAPEERGSQVSFAHPQAYGVMQALIARGVIGDVRPPDLLRFGLCPLYNDADDVHAAVAHLRAVLQGREWDSPAYAKRARVT